MVVMVAVITLTAGVWQMQHVRSIIRQEVNRDANHAMDAAVKVIDSRISYVEMVVETAAAYADLFCYDDKKAYGLLYRLLESNVDIDAACVMYWENFFPQHGRYYCPIVTRNPKTGVMKEENLGLPQYKFYYLEDDENWECSVESDGGYWCQPYYDSLTNHCAVVSYSVPLHNAHGDTYGVLCVDMGLDWVQQMVEDSKPFPYSNVTVLGCDSQYVYHRNENLVQTTNVVLQAQMLNDRSYIELTNRMMKGEKGVDTLDKVMDFTNSKEMSLKEKRALVFYAPIGRVNWSLCFTTPEEKIMEDSNRLRTIMSGVLLLVVLLLAAVLHFILRVQLHPLRQLAESAREVAKGNFHAQLPLIKTRDEIGRLRNSFQEMQQSLESYIEQLKETTASKASIESELRIASDIQMSMIPKDFPAYPERDDVDIYGLLTPAKEVGGDLFDFYIRNEKLFFCIGDVTGKGVPASLLMAVTSSQFRTISAHESKPERIMAGINESIAENNDTAMFVTLFVGVLDLPTGRLRYCNAGHDAPLLIGDVGIGLLPVESNLPVGIVSEWRYKQQDTVINPQTTIFLYTDGLTEAENVRHELFKEKRILKTAQQSTRQPKELISQMMATVKTFVGEAEQSDDLTMLAIQYTKQQHAVTMQRSITLDNNIEDVPQLAAFVDEVCETVGFDMSVAMSLNLAMEEAVVNVMDYAYPAGTKGKVCIEAEADDQQLSFIISDWGKPFDPTAKAEVDTTLSAEDRPIGGLGIHLVRQIMDSINYERMDGKNVLTLRKKLV
jgi:sigma-B regulation protein RsbU (phosphoserine phosphatase)